MVSVDDRTGNFLLFLDLLIRLPQGQREIKLVLIRIFDIKVGVEYFTKSLGAHPSSPFALQGLAACVENGPMRTRIHELSPWNTCRQRFGHAS
jgi:hypothetical protein